MGDFNCIVKEDYERNKRYHCEECGPNVVYSECPHTSVVYGPCRSKQAGFVPVPRTGLAPADPGCRYKPGKSDYMVRDKGTDKESVIFIGDIEKQK